MPTVVVIGSANLDLTVAVERLPREGETVLGGELLLANGGKGANQAVAALRAGAEVRLLANLGRDAFGDRICRDLVAAGLPGEGLLREESAPTGVALVVVDRQGRNQIAVAPGSNHSLLPGMIDENATFLSAGAVMLLQLEIPIATVERSLQFAKARGMTTILNPAPAGDLPEGLLRHVDVLTPNETEAETLTGIAVSDPNSAEAAAKTLLTRGPRGVIVTLGAQGALLCAGSIVRHLPAFGVEVIDTTAAGDAFNGALAAALAAPEGLDILRNARSLVAAARFANAAGALTTTKRGAQVSLPTKDEILGLLSRREKSR